MRLEEFLKDKEAQLLSRQYKNSIERLLTRLTQEDRVEVIAEIESHLYEHIIGDQSGVSELEKLSSAIEKVGSVNDMVEPIVADKMILYARQSLNPTRLLYAFAYNSGRNLRQVVLISLFGLFFIMALSFTGAAIAKVFDPSVGLHVGPRVFVIGTVDEGTDAKEVLGYWIIPLAALVAFVGYWMFHSLLRLIKVR